MLTRLPDPFRTEPTLAAEFLRWTFPAPGSSSSPTQPTIFLAASPDWA